MDTQGLLTKKKVLVLEDERHLANAIREAFALRDYTTIIVDSVENGLHELNNTDDIKVIWLDHYLLGTKNGIDFVVQLKASEKWKKIPIFVVSNSTSTANIGSYIQLGVANYYTKADYDLEQIMNDIDFALAANEKSSS
jgi:DNA-binding response OmpR family regulator